MFRIAIFFLLAAGALAESHDGGDDGDAEVIERGDSGEFKQCYAVGHDFPYTDWHACANPRPWLEVYSGISDDGDFLKIGLRITGEGVDDAWSAIGLAGNGGMKGTRYIVVRQDEEGEWIAEDRFSWDYIKPQKFKWQDHRLMFVKQETFKGQRVLSWGVLLPLNACKEYEVNDYPIDFPLGSSIDRWILFARGASHEFEMHPSTMHRMQFRANLVTGQSKFLPSGRIPTAEHFDAANLTMPNVHIINGPGGAYPDNPYLCSYHDMRIKYPKRDWRKKHHVVRYEPMIDPLGRPYVHHMLVWQCMEDFDFDGRYFKNLEVVPECMEMPSGCYGLKYLWAVGVRDLIMPDEAGMPFGEGYIFYILNMHYYNPNMDENKHDSSGVQLYLTPEDTYRKEDMGVFMIVAGVRDTQRPPLPPGFKAWKDKMQLPSQCTRQWTTPIHVFGAAHHMHLLGKTQRLDVVRAGKHVGQMINQPMYDFIHQSLDDVEVTKLYPGDMLDISCVWDTSFATEPTLYGDATNTEMCFSAFVYWPRQPMMSQTGYYTKAMINVTNETHLHDRLPLLEKHCLTEGTGEFKGYSSCVQQAANDPVSFFLQEDGTGLSVEQVCNFGIAGRLEPEEVNQVISMWMCPMSCYPTKSCKMKQLIKVLSELVCPIVCEQFELSHWPDLSKPTGVQPNEMIWCGVDRGLHYFRHQNWTMNTCAKQGDLTNKIATGIIERFGGKNYDPNTKVVADRAGPRSTSFLVLAAIAVGFRHLGLTE